MKEGRFEPAETGSNMPRRHDAEPLGAQRVPSQSERREKGKR